MISSKDFLVAIPCKLSDSINGVFKRLTASFLISGNSLCNNRARGEVIAATLSKPYEPIIVASSPP